VHRRAFLAGLSAATAGTALFPAAGVRARQPGDSDTITLKLAGEPIMGNLLAADLAEIYLQRMGIARVRRSEDPTTHVLRLEGAGFQGSRAVTIRKSSTAEALADLHDGKIDVAMVARHLAPLGDTFDFQPVALIGMVVAVHPRNPLAHMDMDAARDVFTGRIRDWRQLGGRAGPITVYSRQPNSAGLMTFRRHVMHDAPYRTDMHLLEESADVVEAVANDPAGIAVLPVNRGERIKMLPLHVGGGHTLPDRYGLVTGDYPLTVDLGFATLRKTEDDEGKFLFVEASQSINAAAVVVQKRFASPGPTLLKAPADPSTKPGGIAPAYLDLCRRGLRLSPTVHFAADSTEANAAEPLRIAELVSLFHILRQPAEDLRHVVFCDSQPSPELEREVCARMAQSFVDGLAAEGLKAGQITLLGAAMPLTTEHTPRGRLQNRRVETWLMPQSFSRQAPQGGR
jgi:phosphate transport system substrate-binding protein